MEGARSGGLTPYLRAGAMAAIATLAIDQASKLWLLFVFGIAHRGVVTVTPFFDLVLAWNPGISFGWLQYDGTAAQIALMTVKAVAVVVEKATGTKCARSWKILPTVGEDPEYPDVSPRDAQALREWTARGVTA